MKNILTLLIIISYNLLFSQEPKILFHEGFEDANFESRGWYDHLKGNLSADEHIEGSNFSLECKFLKGGMTPAGGTPGRHLFEETDEVCLSYYVKYSENYVGSGKPYHPHEFHFITNKDSKWVGPAFTHLTTYTEHNGGIPLIAIQDGENIDQSRVGQNLVGISEERAVAGCNGSTDGYPDDCYKSGNVYVNGKQWKAESKYFSDEPGKYYKNDWHHIETYFKLNSIVEGKGIADGVIKYWYDGELIIDHDDILIRTGEHPDMKFNQFLIAPYISDGSPVEQTMWIDDLTVSTSRMNTSTVDDVEEMTMNIIPNPAEDFIEVNFERCPTSPRCRTSNKIEIYNVLGECVKNLTPNLRHTPTPLERGIGEGVLKVDVSDLPVGLYFIKIGDFSKMFVVVR